mmetsp:Transcript_183983/g.583613  ORF Transcript_183983/g.583613 Transcript_183983/m.583613 type:complete len:196 (-) Transcript_183983:113-700(-)
MQGVVETWFSSYLVPGEKVIEFLEGSSDHEVLSAALHGALSIVRPLRSSWDDFAQQVVSDPESDDDFDWIWDRRVDRGSESFGGESFGVGPNRLSEIRRMLAAIMVDPSKFHGHLGCGSALRELGQELCAEFEASTDIVDVNAFMHMQMLVVRSCGEDSQLPPCDLCRQRDARRQLGRECAGASEQSNDMHATIV